MGDMARLMKQAQSQLKDMQKQMRQTEETLKERAVEGSAGGGMVKVIFNGLQEPIDLTIEPEVLKEEDPEFLEEMILAAIRQGLKKSKEMADEERKKATGGLNIPGLEGLM
jgi:DNA-binding YbaB/EbfC family protein